MDAYEITDIRDRLIKRVERLKTVRHELHNYKGISVDDAISTMTDEILSSAKHVRNINNILDDEELIEMLCALEDYLEGFTDPDDEFVENAADIIWNGFIDRHTIQPVETDGITELTILEHWVRLNKKSGMWSGYPLGGAYIDARCGTGYSMPEVKNFVDCDRTVRYQLPHMRGKYCADVELRIDELKEATMSDSEKHHAKLDELIDDARKYMHGMMDSALASGALSHDMEQPDTYFLSRAIITIYGDDRPHAPPSITMNKEIDELAKVL